MDFLLRLMVRYSIEVSPGVQPPVAQLVAGDRPLDLDHLGAEVGQHAARGRGGDVVAELQHPHAGEWTNVCGVQRCSLIGCGCQNRTLIGRMSRIATTDATETPTVTVFSVPRVVCPSSDCSSQNVLLVTCTANSEPAPAARAISTGSSPMIGATGARMPADVIAEMRHGPDGDVQRCGDEPTPRAAGRRCWR